MRRRTLILLSFGILFIIILSMLVARGDDLLDEFQYWPYGISPCLGHSYTGDIESYDIDYQWVADSNSIIIMNAVSGLQSIELDEPRLDLVNIDDRSVETLISYPNMREYLVKDFRITAFMVSPTGKYLAISEEHEKTIEKAENSYTSDYSYETTIFEIARLEKQTELHPLTTILDAFAVSWSLDEKQIAFATTPNPVDSHQQKAISVAQFGPEITDIVMVAEYESLHWNSFVGWLPSGQGVVIEPIGWRILYFDKDSGKVYYEKNRCIDHRAISPTDDKIAMSYHIHRNDDEGENGWDVMIKDIANGRYQIVTDFLDEDERYPDWSPDGKKLVFTRISPTDSADPQQDIVIVDLVSNSMINLTDELDARAFSPKWSPRGDKIAFLTYENRKYHLQVIDVDGTNQIDLYSFQ